MISGVHLIAAVGLSGQIGLRGKVPWHGDEKYAEHTARDLDEFARLTLGGVLIIGQNTASGMLNDFPLGDRMFGIPKRHELADPARYLADIRRHEPNRNIWICGGETVFRAFIPFVDWHHISVVPYDGLADAFLRPIIPGWVSAPDPYDKPREFE